MNATKENFMRYLLGTFSFWRAIETPGKLLIKIADGPISFAQLTPLEHMRPIGVAVHFQTYSWFVRKLFHYRILKSYRWVSKL